MFEGMPLPISPLDAYVLPLWICAVGLGATALLKIQFDREWALTMYTAYQIQRVWQRLADESARTGGTLTSHGIGIISWALLGSLWGVNASTTPNVEVAGTGAMWGALIGLITLITRQVGGWIGVWVTLEREAIERGFEVDRHMRNWLLWILIALVLWELAQFNGFESRGEMWMHVSTSWWIWLALKWMRQFQSVINKQLHIGWGIAYICTLEIGPSFLLFEYAG
ncbi:MAG: hypothetical protein CL828_08830 [Crocinitomicaceae bacterium]|nr:hypothetical protein [Crocinitomicaceae bacterium]